MAIVPLNANVLTAPGVYIGEGTAGIAPVELATFNRAYMLGSAEIGNYAEPRQITNIDDAINQFGLLAASTNARSVELFFKNHPYGIFYYTRVPIGGLWTFTLGGTPVAGDTLVFTLDPLGLDPVEVIHTVSVEGEADFGVLLAELVLDVNNSGAIAAFVIAERIDLIGQSFNIRMLDPTTTVVETYVSLEGGIGTGTTVSADFVTATALHPTRDDFLWTIAEAFDPDEHRQGFIFAPEAFKHLDRQADRTAVGQALGDHASSEGFDWIALVDSGPPAQIMDPAAAVIEGKLLSAPFGHLAYYYPYVIDTNEDELPVSPAVAAIALRRYESQGFNQPPAGAQFPLRGVVDVKFRVKKQVQAVLNPDGINVVRKIPNTGICVYGARTRSTNPYYRFVNTRVILAVLIGTLRTAFDTEVFTAIDGQGILFTRLRETTKAICYRLYAGGALFGATPEEAYFVKVDRENNPDLDLEAGVVRMDVYVVPAPTMERLLISVNRTSIGGIEFVARQVS